MIIFFPHLQVLIFLDSHIEVNVDWIQPLLSRISESRKNVVVPIIDIINAETFKYTSSPLVRGGFNWGKYNFYFFFFIKRKMI